MKRLTAWLLLALLLCGCSNAETHSDDGNIQATLPQFPALTTPSLYDAQNPIENATDGAVRAYLPKSGENICIKPMGNYILLLGSDRTMLLRGDRLAEIASAEIPNLPAPDSGMV